MNIGELEITKKIQLKFIINNIKRYKNLENESVGQREEEN